MLDGRRVVARLLFNALMRTGVEREDIHCDIASDAKASRPKFDLVLQLLRW